MEYVQVFLTFCTLVTLYFADEVPLNVNQPRHLSDSAPLLNGSQQNGHELSTSESYLPGLDNLSGNGNNHDHELRMNSKHANSVGDQNENFSDGPGAVLVNLLTSLRHLPPGMHSVLVVMALTWVSTSITMYYFQNCFLLISFSPNSFENTRVHCSCDGLDSLLFYLCLFSFQL
jgi:hypothetical protein